MTLQYCLCGRLWVGNCPGGCKKCPATAKLNYIQDTYGVSKRGSAHHAGLKPTANGGLSWLATDSTRNTLGGKVHDLPTANTMTSSNTGLAWQSHAHTQTHASNMVASPRRCSHVTCSIKKHTCSKYNKDATTWGPEPGIGTYEWDGADGFPFAKGTKLSFQFDADECDGTVHYGIVVKHHRAENVCASTGHHCGKGVLTGGTGCECQSLHM